MKYCVNCESELEGGAERMCDSCQYDADVVAEELNFEKPRHRPRKETKSIWDIMDEGDENDMEGNEEAVY